MNIWIVTTGSSDVQLKNEKNWNPLYRNVRSQLYSLRFSPSRSPEPDDDEHYQVPARVLGIVYTEQLDKYYGDLHFPLLDTFSQKLKQPKNRPDKIILILTNQEAVFEESKRGQHKSPYWQDTCTLKSIFKRYLQENFSTVKQIEFLELKPQNENEGLDNWNKTLRLVQEALFSLTVDKMSTIYVSHQAGTPAISSAVQFVSLARFGNQVQFLVSNEYKKQPEDFIKSSEYLQEIQLQQVKELVKSGAPGAAMELLELEGIKAEIDTQAVAELEKLVDFFNLNRSLAMGESEFDIEPAVQRVFDAIELVRILFKKQKNYLLGIALLAAAQETFLKIAVMSKIAILTETVNLNGHSYKVSELVTWDPPGLFLNNVLKCQTIEIKKHILSKLKFPVEKVKLNSDDDFKATNKNFVLLAWVEKLELNFKPWPLLIWSCKHYRNSDDDLRNQLMHNLRGMELTEVSQYLSGDATPSNPTDVVQTYDNLVKNLFIKELERFGFVKPKEKLEQRLQSVAESISLIGKYSSVD